MPQVGRSLSREAAYQAVPQVTAQFSPNTAKSPPNRDFRAAPTTQQRDRPIAPPKISDPSRVPPTTKMPYVRMKQQRVHTRRWGLKPRSVSVAISRDTLVPSQPRGSLELPPLHTVPPKLSSDAHDVRCQRTRRLENAAPR